MTFSPPVTVITPNLNQRPYLEQTLCSVLDQGYESLEFMVTDGGSTDGSIEVVRLYEDGLSCWRSGPDSGPGSAINWALSRAAGQLVMVLPSDDLLLPGAIETAAAYFSATDSADWLMGQAQMIGPADEPLGPVLSRGIERSAEQRAIGAVLAKSSHPTPPLAACCFRKSLFDSLGSFDESPWGDFALEWIERLYEAGHRPARIGTTLAAVRDSTPHPPTDSVMHPSIRINTEVCRGLTGGGQRLNRRAA